MLDLDVNSPRGAAFVRRFFKNQPIEYVPRRDMMVAKQCYRNVREKVAQFGGEPVWGWALKEADGLYAEAMHHAIWQNSAGDLLDVTPTSQANINGQTVFIRDKTMAVTEYDPGVPSKFHQYDKSKAVDAWIRQNVHRMKLINEATTMMRRLPHRVTPAGIELRDPRPPRLGAIIHEIEKLGEIIRDLDRRIMSGTFD